jgi:RNA processing factor Prp31
MEQIRELSLFDLMQQPKTEVKHRRKHHRISRKRSENVKAFRSFLIAYKMDMDKGIKVNVKKLQNQFHVGHFPKSYIPVAKLRESSLEDINDGFAKICYKEIQKYNQMRDSTKTSKSMSTTTTSNNVKVSSETAVQLIDSAISSLQDLKKRLTELINA